MKENIVSCKAYLDEAGNPLQVNKKIRISVGLCPGIECDTCLKDKNRIIKKSNIPSNTPLKKKKRLSKKSQSFLSLLEKKIKEKFNDQNAKSFLERLYDIGKKGGDVYSINQSISCISKLHEKKNNFEDMNERFNKSHEWYRSELKKYNHKIGPLKSAVKLFGNMPLLGDGEETIKTACDDEGLVKMSKLVRGIIGTCPPKTVPLVIRIGL